MSHLEQAKAQIAHMFHKLVHKDAFVVEQLGLRRLAATADCPVAEQGGVEAQQNSRRHVVAVGSHKPFEWPEEGDLELCRELLADDNRQRKEKPTSVLPKGKERDQFKHLFGVVLAIPLLQVIPEEVPNRGGKLLPHTLQQSAACSRKRPTLLEVDCVYRTILERRMPVLVETAGVGVVAIRRVSCRHAASQLLMRSCDVAKQL